MAKKKIGRICNFFGLKGQLKVQVSSTTAVDRFKVGKKSHHQESKQCR